MKQFLTQVATLASNFDAGQELEKLRKDANVVIRQEEDAAQVNETAREREPGRVCVSLSVKLSMLQGAQQCCNQQQQPVMSCC